MASQHVNRSIVWGLGTACLVLLVVGLLYLATLDTGLRPGELTGGDLITHQYAQVLARPSNAPGYPLYTLGGWAWFHALRAVLPQANPTALLASYSTLWALLALAVLFILLASITARNWLLSALITLLYAVTYFFWYYAVTSEQYTSAVLQTLLFVWLAWTWDARRAEPATPHHRLTTDHILLLMALLTGIALAHLVTVLAILPPLAWFVLSRQPGLLRQPRWLLSLALVALLPLLSYLFIYVRGAQHPEWRGVGEWASTWQWFWSFVSTSQGRSELTWSLTPLWTAEWPALWWRELTVVGLVIGIAGWVRLGRRGILLAATSVIYLVFSFFDRLGNWYQVVMPVYALLALGIGAVAAAAWHWAGSRLTPAWRPVLLRSLLVAGLGGWILFQFVNNFPRADQSHRPDDKGLQPGWHVLATDPPANAAILATQPEADALRYLGIVGGVRDDIVPLTAAEARTRLNTGEAVYVTLDAAPLVTQEVLDSPHWRAVGPGLLQLLGAPDFTSPSGLARPVSDGVVLRDARVQPVTVHASAPWQYPDAAPASTAALDVHLTWQALRAPQHDWSISLRPTFQGQPVSRDGQPLQVDVQHPVYGQYPTSGWSAGERVDEVYRLPLPADVPVDGLTLVVYRVLADGSFENLAEISIESGNVHPQ